MNKIEKCKRCGLYKNQLPLLDEIKELEIMWVGLSAKKVNNINETHPLANDTNTGRIIEQIENEINQHTFYKTNLVKCVPLNEKTKLLYPHNTNAVSKKGKENIYVITYNFKTARELLKVIYYDGCLCLKRKFDRTRDEDIVSTLVKTKD